MTIRVSPTEPNPTHDISLTSGSTTIGLHLCNGQGQKDRRSIRKVSTPRTSLQTSQGDPDYSNFNLPYSFISQKDWSGGRGQLEFRRDPTRYYDAYGVDTRLGNLMLAPKRYRTMTGILETGPKTGDISITQNSNEIYYASKIVPSTTIAVERIRINVGVSNSTAGDILTIMIYNDTAGAPGALNTTFFPDTTQGDFTANDYYVYIPGAPGTTTTLTAGTTYWLVVLFGAVGIINNYTLGYNNSVSGNTIITKTNAGAWSTYASNQAIDYSLYPSSPASVIFFEYRGSTYAVSSTDTGAAPKLYINGYHGVATGGTVNTITLGMSTSGLSLQGAICRIWAGTGSNESQPWREIYYMGNTATGVVGFTEPWNKAPDTTSEWFITGVDTWTLVTGTNLTGKITDVLVVDDVIYFAAGDTTTIKKARWSAGSFTWDTDADIDATYKGATFMELITATSGTRKVWLAQATRSKVYSADTQTWSTDFTFSTAIVCGSSDYRITNLVAYGTPQAPWVIKENEFGSIENNIYAAVPISELGAAKSETNGRAACQAGVYLWFNMGEGFERYYDNHLDDLGPNRDQGLPLTRRGTIMSAVPYPGGVIVVVDGGGSGYGSILFYNGLGWHELYRSDVMGLRMRSLFVQVVPGDTPDRLWFSEGYQLSYIHISINPLKQPDYAFTDTGYLITSWIATGFGTIIKFWRSFSIFANSLTVSNNVAVYYQTDDDDDTTAWTAISGSFTTSPSQQQLISSGYSVTGKRIRFKIVLTGSSSAYTPDVYASGIEAVTRVPPSKQYGVTFQADDVTVDDAEGSRESLDMDGLLDQLESWASSDETPAPLLMRSVIPAFDNVYVFIEAPNVTLAQVDIYESSREVKAIGSLTITVA